MRGGGINFFQNNGTYKIPIAWCPKQPGKPLDYTISACHTISGNNNGNNNFEFNTSLYVERRSELY